MSDNTWDNVSNNVWKVVPILLLVGLAVVVLAQPAPTRGQTPIDESFQPVVVSGATLETLVSTSTSKVFVFAYRDGDWEQIPFQIDEKTAGDAGGRVYTAQGDGRLDADEELVFMLKDMGEPAPPSAWPAGAVEDFRIELMAELGAGSRHFAYVFHSSELEPAFTEDYVRFSGAAQRLIAESYAVGFLDNGAGLDEVRLNGSGIDILDRTKIRLRVAFLNYTEETLPVETGPIVPVKDGPVRVVWGESGGFAYGSLFQDQLSIDLSDLPLPVSVSFLRFSWDFDPQIVATSTPTTYLDANLGTPVVIDGEPDDVPDTPVPIWRQVSHTTGTIILVSNLSSLGGTQQNYYEDDGTFDSNDTGDGRSYGDAGFQVDRPNNQFTLDTRFLVLPPTFENVGQTYADLMQSAPAVTPAVQLSPSVLDHKTYLPLIRR